MLCGVNGSQNRQRQCAISGVRRDVHQICDHLGFYAAPNGNFVPNRWHETTIRRCVKSQMIADRRSQTTTTLRIPNFLPTLQRIMRCATSRTVPGSIPGGVTGDFFRGSFRQNHLPWVRLSPWKWVAGISPEVKAAGAYGWRPTTLVVPKVKKIRSLNIPGTPRATSACRGTPLLYFTSTNNRT